MIKSIQAKLANEEFVANAPEVVVEKEKARLMEFEEAREVLVESL